MHTMNYFRGNHKWKPLLFSILLVLSSAFSPVKDNHFFSCRSSTSLTMTSMMADWEDWWRNMLSTKKNPRKGNALEKNDNIGYKSVGVILRCAARKYQGKDSTPSSSKYTTRKDEFESVEVVDSGVFGDYNHYRTVALKGTADRAVSILTKDVIDTLKDEGGYYSTVKAGDLGENLFVDNLLYSDFKVGMKVEIFDQDTNNAEDETVVLEITEPIVPCANLCKLSFINNPSTDPKQKIENCKNFLERLAEEDGLRGWYAKVLSTGKVAKGYSVKILE